MSMNLSPAQTLPADVLHSIFKWVAFEQQSPIREYSYIPYYLREPLAVCSTWRQISLEYMWRRLGLTVDVKGSAVGLNHPYWREEYRVPHYAICMVKDVSISVPLSAIVTGEALKLLADYTSHTKCFPLADKMLVTVTDCDNKRFDSNDRDVVIANVVELAKLLKSLAPEAKIMDVKCCRANWKSRENDDNDDKSLEEGALMTFAGLLYADSIHKGFDLSSVVFDDLSTIYCILPLSSLKVHKDLSPDECSSLFHKSASTLLYLDVSLGDANILINDSNGKHVLYPNLQHLRLKSLFSLNQSLAKTVAATIVPFPMLRSLRLSSEYPFVDDVLFRGNTATLEYLEISLDKRTIIMLNQWRVFEDRHKPLRHVLIKGRWGYTEDPDDTRVDVNKCLNNLMALTGDLRIGGAKLIKAFVAAAQLGQGFQSIRVLETYSHGLSFFNLLSLLKALPTLTKVLSGVEGWGPELESIAIEELPDYILSTYTGVGNNLEYWEMVNDSDKHYSIAIDYILLLALACPKLWRIQIHPAFVCDCHTKIAEALNSQLYSRYAPRLNKILDIIREKYSGCDSF